MTVEHVRRASPWLVILVVNEAMAGLLPPVPPGAMLVETAVYRFRMDVSASSLAGWSLDVGG